MTHTSARVLFSLSVVALAIGASPALAGAGQAPDVVHATVAPGSQTDPRGAYYVLQAKPGTTITQQVVIKNPNDHTVTADVSGVDAWTGDATGVSYGTPGSTPKSTGSWITFVTPQLQLAAHESRTIPFTVTVPSTVVPGQYLGAVSAFVPSSATPTTVPQNGTEAGFAVKLQLQRIIAVEVDVPGPRQPNLVVQGVKPVVQADSLRLQFTIANSGNAFAKGHGTLSVADTNTRHDFTIDTFVSHTSIKLALAWTKNVVPGLHQVSLRLEDQTGRVVTWSGPVDVSGSTGAALARTLAAAQSAKLHHSASGTSVPWWPFLLVPICIAAAVHLHRRRAAGHPVATARRGGSRGATATPPRAHEPEPSTPSDGKAKAGVSR